MKIHAKILFAALFLAWAAQQTPAYAAPRHPFDEVERWIRESYGSRLLDSKIDISVGGAAARLLESLSGDVDLEDDLNLEIEKIEKIRFAVFELRDGGRRPVPASLLRRFRRGKWEKVLQAREEDGHALAFLKWESQNRALAALVVQNEDELVYIGFSGKFRLRPTDR